jgi:3-isopropylmalate dehydrogenase
MTDRKVKRIAVIPGDGIGPEVVAEAVGVLDVVRETHGVGLELQHFDWGADKYLREGVSLPEGALEMLTQNFDAILAGAFGDPRVKSNQHAEDILLGMRRGLDLYINLRPVRLLDARLTPLRDRQPDDVNFVVFREKKVTMADKSNVQRFGGDLWQRTFREVAGGYTDIEANHQYVDAMAMFMILDPAQYDVVVTNNLFGDILTDLGAALQGGLGMAASGNIHPGRVSLFEPVHGSAPPLAGKNVANPVGAILTTAMMLEYLGHDEAARAVEAAVMECVRARETTRDLGGELSTAGAGDAVRRRLGRHS